MIEEFGADLVPNKCYGLPFEHTHRSRLQHITQIVLRHSGPDHFMERLTVT